MEKDNFEKLKERIRDVLDTHGEIKVAYLYGSVTKGHENKYSDIDIGLLLSEKFKSSGLYPAKLAREIKTKCALSTDIDVRLLDNRPPIFLHQVLKDGELILSKDEKRRIDFETAATCRYMDIKPHYTEYDEKRKGRLLA